MPDLLLELFSEEIPARMQAKAAEDLRRMVTDKLVAEGLVYEGAKAFATPRRLALTVHGIPARQPDLKTERRGPKIGAPDAAVQGFLKATGLDVARRGQDPARPEGRLLHRADREARPRRDRRARGNPARDHPHLPLAEIDALGRALRQAGLAELGASAARDHRDVRARDRRARCREILGGRHRGRPDHLRPPLHGARRDFRAPLRGLRSQAEGRKGHPRSAGAQGHHLRRRQGADLRARVRTGRGSGAAGRGVRSGRMARRHDGIVRRRSISRSRTR